MWGEVYEPLVDDKCHTTPIFYENSHERPFSIILEAKTYGFLKMVAHTYFHKKMGVVWPFIIDQRLINLTPHMFPCHRSHSWISGGDHFLVKNSYVLAFGIIENGRSWLFSTKMGVVETISWSKIRRCQPLVLLKMVAHGYFHKKWGLCGQLSSTRGS